MAKFSGVIGFIKTDETRPGIWEDIVYERRYCGDIIKYAGRYQQTTEKHDDIKMSNRLSIVADGYINSNFIYVKYVIILGVKWKITDVEVEHPRIILTLGEIYNG